MQIKLIHAINAKKKSIKHIVSCHFSRRIGGESQRSSHPIEPGEGTGEKEEISKLGRGRWKQSQEVVLRGATKRNRKACLR